ncbi:MAG: multidrug effflux MFS transporter [Bacteroidaceae bacterium]|nr:multidrug effflux MFS transporter [Bacteroidaceae bacterium]
MKQRIGYFVPATLGMLTAFGPIVTDFYLPSMPEMQEYFRTSPSMVAMSLTAGMIGLALGQILIGPLSDKWGRKRLLTASMLLFAVASVLCMFAPNVYVFNAMRVLQGFGGAGGVVLSKSISADMYTGKELADFMAVLAAINGIAPIVAPVLGGTMANFTSWKGVFCLLLVIGILLMACSVRLRETLPPEKRTRQSVWHAYGNLLRVFRNRRFTLSTLAMMLTFFTFFAYISSSPFIFQQIYGLSPFEYSLCFGLNALMIGVGSALAVRFHHQNTALKWGSIDFMVSAVLVAMCQCFRLPLAVLMPCYIYMLLSFGLMQPVATAIALDAERDNAGAASAVFGAAGFMAGALASPLVSMGNILVSTSVVMLVGALGCLCLTLPLCAAVKQEGMKKLRGE